MIFKMYICSMVKNNGSFCIGTRVGVINDTLTGIITEINKDAITFESDEGFEYQYDKNELIVKGELNVLLKNNSFHEATIEKKSTDAENPISIKSGKRNNPPLEIDLHIHQLIDSEKGMSNFDMLNLQLKTVKKHLELAIKNNAQRIVFIHGVGEGVLRTELHYLLKKYPVEFYEASYKNYGQGATEVYIYQNVK